MDREIEKIANNLDFTSNSLVLCSNGLYLTNYEIEILNKYHIPFNNLISYKEIIFRVEDILDDEELDDLESVSKSISERDYYNNTNK